MSFSSGDGVGGCRLRWRPGSRRAACLSGRLKRVGVHPGGDGLPATWAWVGLGREQGSYARASLRGDLVVLDFVGRVSAMKPVLRPGSRMVASQQVNSQLVVDRPAAM